MNLVIRFEETKQKVLLKVEQKDYVEVSFESLLELTSIVIDTNRKLIINLEGFENAPDLGETYKKMFEDISELKEDQEILELKKKIDDDASEKSESKEG